uniref:Phospholipase-like protein n=1 Tax=Tanacetum cinerariifolium TaxID=118510 RepID=A0A6L2KH32_TANCI|nr:phospholipase-like protein [Tanacetum cinerariifolium]
MLRCEHEKLIVDEIRFRLDEANRLRLEEENMLQLEEQKKNKRNEFMNSSHGKNILAKLAPAKRNQLGSSSEKINSKVIWVEIKNINDPCIAKLLKNVKPWVEDISRVLHCMDTVWLSDDVERFLGQPGQVKCKFPWNDDYTVDRNFWLKLVCFDPARKGWLTEEERHEQILELQSLVGSNVAAESVRLLKEFLYDDLESSRGMMRLIYETQLKLVDVMLWWCYLLLSLASRSSKTCKCFSKERNRSKLAHGLSLDVDDPVDVSLAYREKMV